MPIRFCLLVILTHLKGSALAVPVLGTWAVVKVVLGNLKYELLVISSLEFAPQGAPAVPEALPRPANFSWQSSLSSVGLVTGSRPAALVGSITSRPPMESS